MLLTAATGLGTSERAHRRYIREVAEVGVTAIIFELGRGFQSIPRAMVDEARQSEIVLVSLEREVPFVAVTHLVHTELISSNHAALFRATEIDEALSQAILDGASLSAVLELLAERLDAAVVLEDVSHRVVAYGRRPGVFAPTLKNWQAHSGDVHEARRGAARRSTSQICPSDARGLRSRCAVRSGAGSTSSRPMHRSTTSPASPWGEPGRASRSC